VIVNDSGAYALRYAGIGDIRSVEAYYRLNKAHDFDEWRAVLARQGVIATNFVYADAVGNIGLFYNARFPRRAEGFAWRGILPGDDPRALWTGYEPFAATPAVVNPRSGWVANANNTPFVATAPADQLRRDAYPDRFGIETYMPNRAHRFAALFAVHGDAPVGRDALLRIKFDKGYARGSWAGRWIDRVLAADTRDAPELRRAQDLLRGWDWTQDGQGRADALAAMLLKAAARAGYRGDPLPAARPALADAAAFLTTHFGRLDPPLSDLLRIRRGSADVSVLGGPDALRAIYSEQDDDRGRLVADLGDSFVMLIEWPKGGPVRSWSVQPWGAAIERPSSRHYSDQSALFAGERFKPVRFEEADLRRRQVREYRP
jgi:acyl-homoserine-lactone acylase